MLPPDAEPAEDAIAESVIHAEVDRQTDPRASSRRSSGHLLRVIGEVRAAVEDWPAMRAPRARDRRPSSRARRRPASTPRRSPRRAPSSTWLEDHNFTFLGYRDYDIVDEDGELRLRAVAGLGPRHPAPAGRRARARARSTSCRPRCARCALEPHLLNLTKANSRATVHRPAYLDYVGVKRFDAEGKVIGERRFLGLYTHTAYHASPREIPILRRKVDARPRARRLPARAATTRRR